MFGMAHRREQPRLLQQLAEVEALLVRDLDGHLLVDPGVLGQVHAAEAAAAESRDDAVLADGLSAKEHQATCARVSAKPPPRAAWREYTSVCLAAACGAGHNASRAARFFVQDAGAPGTTVRLPADEALACHSRPAACARGVDRRLRRARAGVRRRRGGGDKHVDVRIDAEAAAVPEPAVAVTLAHAVLKGDKMDGVVRDAVMMGAAAIRPIVTRHSEASLAGLARGQRVERWRRVAVASAKQCGRAVVPEVLDPRDIRGRPDVARVRARAETGAGGAGCRRQEARYSGDRAAPRRQRGDACGWPRGRVGARGTRDSRGFVRRVDAGAANVASGHGRDGGTRGALRRMASWTSERPGARSPEPGAQTGGVMRKLVMVVVAFGFLMATSGGGAGLQGANRLRPRVPERHRGHLPRRARGARPGQGAAGARPTVHREHRAPRGRRGAVGRRLRSAGGIQDLRAGSGDESGGLLRRAQGVRSARAAGPAAARAEHADRGGRAHRGPVTDGEWPEEPEPAARGVLDRRATGRTAFRGRR